MEIKQDSMEQALVMRNDSNSDPDADEQGGTDLPVQGGHGGKTTRGEGASILEGRNKP